MSSLVGVDIKKATLYITTPQQHRKPRRLGTSACTRANDREGRDAPSHRAPSDDANSTEAVPEKGCDSMMHGRCELHRMCAFFALTAESPCTQQQQRPYTHTLGCRVERRRQEHTHPRQPFHPSSSLSPGHDPTAVHGAGKVSAHKEARTEGRAEQRRKKKKGGGGAAIGEIENKKNLDLLFVAAAWTQATRPRRAVHSSSAAVATESNPPASVSLFRGTGVPCVAGECELVVGFCSIQSFEQENASDAGESSCLQQ